MCVSPTDLLTTDKPPAQNGDKFRSIFSDNLQQSQLAEGKHVARYWQGWARDVKARDRDETFVALETRSRR